MHTAKCPQKNKLTTTTLSTKLISTSSSHWLGNAGEDVIDENPFHNCVRPYFQCQQKDITWSRKLDWIEQHSKHIFNSRFIHICLDTISLQMVRSEEMAVFTGKDTSALKQQCMTLVMHV